MTKFRSTRVVDAIKFDGSESMMDKFGIKFNYQSYTGEKIYLMEAPRDELWEYQKITNSALPDIPLRVGDYIINFYEKDGIRKFEVWDQIEFLTNFEQID